MRLHRLLACSVLALTTACGVRGGAKTESPELRQPSRELDLASQASFIEFENGLRLLVVPDPYTNLVEFDVRQHVGSRDNPPGKDGLAHFVEHLMFQIGADGPGTTRLMQELPRHTLFFNAYTSADETHYMHNGLSGELENYFKYTARRLNYNCEEVSDAAFERERDVVRNEHRWRYGGAFGVILKQAHALAYPEGHPYHQTGVDIDEDLVSITPDDACKFIKTYYTAGQADVIITGDVDPQEALALAKKYLVPLPKLPDGKRKPVPVPVTDGKVVEVKAPVKKPTALVLFRMPKRFTPNYQASQACIETMAIALSFFVDNGPLGVVKSWGFQGFGGKEAQLIGVAVETKQPEQLDRGIDEVLDAITRGFAPKLDDKEYRGAYDSARQRARLQVLDAVATITQSGNAFAGYLEEPGAQPGFYGADIAELDDLTSEQAQSVGRKIFAREKALIIKVVPDGSEPEIERAQFDYKPEEEESHGVPEDIDPAEARRPIELVDIAPPEGQSVEYELDNGMKVVLVQSSGMPVMDVQLVVAAGTLDAAEQPDLAMLSRRTFGPDYESTSARNLMDFFDKAGGLFQSFTTAGATTYTSRGLSIYLDFIIAGLSEQTVNAAYRTRALEGWKAANKQRLKKQRWQQEAKRVNRFYEEVYGKGHPHVRPRITDPKQLRDINIRDLEAFRAKHYRAGNSAIIVTGGFDMELAIAYVERFFGSPDLRDRDNAWLEAYTEPDAPPVPQPKPGSVRVLSEVDAERVQTDVQIDFGLAEVYGDDHAALMVMAEMLNFGVGRVRMELGASYGTYARLDTDRPRISIGGAIDSARAGEGVAAILAAIEELRTREDFERRFAFARRNVLQSMINAQGDPKAFANTLARAVRSGRSYAYFR
ncbi:MAG: insulinase family protein, partial [Myxococcota bacterium]